MALLSTEDVLNKTFQSVKFREGYDQVEVDEFLDEVVETIYALQVENTELKQKLEAAQLRVEELEGSESDSAPAPVVAEPVEEVKPEPEPEPELAPAPAPVAAAAPTSTPEDATSMLALAQRVHDEYVRDGREEGERIIAEAREEGSKIVAEAEDKRDSILNQLDVDRGMLEGKINELKSFEAEYRTRLREQLQSFLSEVAN